MSLRTAGLRTGAHPATPRVQWGGHCHPHFREEKNSGLQRLGGQGRVRARGQVSGH